MSEVMKLNHAQVMEIIPHRDPMLLIDEVSELVPGDHIVATFWVDPQREIFKGHFPGDPVLPGVYTVEATAQATDLVLMTKPAYAGNVPLFLGINNVKFRKKVVPGDTLLFKVELIAPIRHGISSMHGFVFVGETIVMEATFTAQIIKNK